MICHELQTLCHCILCHKSMAMFPVWWSHLKHYFVIFFQFLSIVLSEFPWRRSNAKKRDWTLSHTWQVEHGRTIDRWCWLTSESTGLGESAMSLLHTCVLDRTSAWNFTLPFMALCVSSEISFLEEKLLPCHIFTFKCLDISTGIPGFSCHSTCLSCRTQFGHTGENTTLESRKRGRGTGENPSTIATTQQKHTKTYQNTMQPFVLSDSESGLDHVNRNITGQFNFNNFKIKSPYWKKGSWNHFGHPLWLSCLHARKGDKEHDSKALSDEINALGGHHCTCDALHLPRIFGIGMCLGEFSPERLIQRHNPEALTRYLYSL